MIYRELNSSINLQSAEMGCVVGGDSAQHQFRLDDLAYQNDVLGRDCQNNSQCYGGGLGHAWDQYDVNPAEINKTGLTYAEFLAGM